MEPLRYGKNHDSIVKFHAEHKEGSGDVIAYTQPLIDGKHEMLYMMTVDGRWFNRRTRTSTSRFNTPHCKWREAGEPPKDSVYIGTYPMPEQIK